MGSENIGAIVVSSNYSGVCEHAPLTNEDILKLTSGSKDVIINGSTLFALKYRMLPCTLERRWDEDKHATKQHKKSSYYHATSVLDFLVEKYKLDPNNFLYKHTYDTHNKDSIMSNVYIDLNNYLAIRFGDGFRSSLPKDNPHGLKPDKEGEIFYCFIKATIYHAPQVADQAETLLQQLCQFELYDVSKATLQMVCHSTYGFYTTPIQMKKPQITDLNLHYGDDFALIHEGLVEILQEKDSTGITMFHGPPGTGKTNYLRYLINEIHDKKLIYVPPDLVSSISKPDFLPFIMKHPNSILIIEDAENIIIDRKEQHTLSAQAVSNLLNLSDGLLGDAVHQQIICTFNCAFRSIDPALLREGRLVLEHKFDKLSVENARRLCVELGVPDNGEDIHEPASLAEIYARKNAAGNTSANNDDVNDIKAKIKRLFKIKRQQSNTFLGLYS